jgi:histidyl-tRNA synthetase
MAQKPSVPKGTRDFIPEEMVKRNYIFDTIRTVFQRYGFLPIETPAMENLSTLLGKYGEEGDKLLFRILNSGDFLSKASPQKIAAGDSNALSFDICEKGLRYDLTVPFARFVVQHQNEISFPFKRYQIQPVWRADRPQKGRYREFFQCDVDVVGSDSLLNEVELIQIIDRVFVALGVSVTIKINNRKILSGIAEIIGEPDKIVDITVAIDKLDKIGLDKVNDELREKGISDIAIEKLQPIICLTGSNDDKVAVLKNILSSSTIGLAGVSEMEEIFGMAEFSDIAAIIELDLTLARGLNYYTGAIFEVKANDVQIGSICGGGRYDNLTGIFGLPGMSGVGISFGADRIYDVLNHLNLYPEQSGVSTKVLFVNFGKSGLSYCLKALSQLRKAGINAEIFPDDTKMKKQMGYADKKNIPFVVLAGESEMEQEKYTLKNMADGTQQLLSLNELIEYITA